MKNTHQPERARSRHGWRPAHRRRHRQHLQHLEVTVTPECTIFSGTVNRTRYDLTAHTLEEQWGQQELLSELRNSNPHAWPNIHITCHAEPPTGGMLHKLLTGYGLSCALKQPTTPGGDTASATGAQNHVDHAQVEHAFTADDGSDSHQSGGRTDGAGSRPGPGQQFVVEDDHEPQQGHNARGDLPDGEVSGGTPPHGELPDGEGPSGGTRAEATPAGDLLGGGVQGGVTPAEELPRGGRAAPPTRPRHRKPSRRTLWGRNWRKPTATTHPRTAGWQSRIRAEDDTRSDDALAMPSPLGAQSSPAPGITVRRPHTPVRSRSWWKALDPAQWVFAAVTLAVIAAVGGVIATINPQANAPRAAPQTPSPSLASPRTTNPTPAGAHAEERGIIVQGPGFHLQVPAGFTLSPREDSSRDGASRDGASRGGGGRDGPSRGDGSRGNTSSADSSLDETSFVAQAPNATVRIIIAIDAVEQDATPAATHSNRVMEALAGAIDADDGLSWAPEGAFPRPGGVPPGEVLVEYREHPTDGSAVHWASWAVGDKRISLGCHVKNHHDLDHEKTCHQAFSSFRVGG